MTREELELIDSLLVNFLTYEVTVDLMLEDDIKEALVAVRKEIASSHPIPGAGVKQGAHYKEAQSKGE